MKFIAIFALSVLTALIDLPRLARRRKRRQLIAATVLLLTGLVAAEIWAAQLAVPTIGAVLRWLAGPLAGE